MPGRKRVAERIISVALMLVLIVGMVLPFSEPGDLLPANQTPQAGNLVQSADNGEAEDAAAPASPAQTSVEQSAESQTTELPVLSNTAADAIFNKLTEIPIAVETPGTGQKPSDVTPPEVTPLPGVTDTEDPTDPQPDEITPAPPATDDGASDNTVAEEEYDSFEYEPYSSNKNKWSITKYTGNASKVTVPAVIDGKPVASIERGTFADNSRITEITFESDARQTYLRVNSGCMSNLSSLTTIRLPDTDLGVHGDFAVNCLSLREIEVDSNQYLFENGALYYWSSKEWRLRYYAPACTNETLTVPEWCAGIENVCNLEENPYLKRLNLHKYATLFPDNYRVNDALEYINVEAGNTHAFSVDGVLFQKSSDGKYSFSCYPPGKKDKTFKLPENVTLQVSRLECPYLEEIWIPKSSGVNSTSALYFRRCFTNLKVIHLEKGHSYEATCRSTFTGRTEMY